MQMAIQKIIGVMVVVLISVAWLAPAEAQVQGVLLDDDDDSLDEPEVETEQAEAGESTRLGIGVRLRQVFIPESVLEIFVEEAAGGGSHTGFGLELIRQKGNFALILGVEYEKLEAGEGVWIDKGDSIPTDEPDRIEFDDFSWVGVDVNLVWQANLHRMLPFRYGVGLGVGFILGEVLRTDLQCTSSDVGSCQPYEGRLNDRTPEEDIWPVYPIVSMLVGLQIRPVENLAITFEGGLRTVPFIGTSAAYLF